MDKTPALGSYCVLYSHRCLSEPLTRSELALWRERFKQDREAVAPTNFMVEDWCKRFGVPFVFGPPQFVRLARSKVKEEKAGILFIPQKKGHWQAQDQQLIGHFVVFHFSAAPRDTPADQVAVAQQETPAPADTSAAWDKLFGAGQIRLVDDKPEELVKKYISR